jgi:microcystin-dependent protein
MSDCYLGEIRMFAGNFAPVGWALCQGQLLNISENDALYALLGTTYGGDGATTFGLPDLQGRVPIHPSSTYPLATKGGTESVTLITDQMPTHTHVPSASSTTGTQASPSGNVWAASGTSIYSNGSGQIPVGMNAQSISAEGGNQPHENMMPTLTLSFIIALQGIYPTQS